MEVVFVIRKGLYGVYQGKEYSLGKEDGEFINIVSRDIAELKMGLYLMRGIIIY